MRKKPKKRPRRLSKIDGKPLISRQKAEKKLWEAFSAYIRKRDGKCMMGEMWGGCSGPIQAGHIISRRKRPTKYHILNVHGQCATHNWLHNRNPERYIAWFVKRYDKENYMMLVELSAQPTKALSRDECIQLAAHYKKLTEAL